MTTDPPQFPITRASLDQIMMDVYAGTFQDDWPSDQMLTHPEPREAFVLTVLAIAHRRGRQTDEVTILSGLLALRKSGKLQATRRKPAAAVTSA